MDIAILQLFSGILDTRVKGRCYYTLENILFISLCTLISNGEDYEDMVELGNQRLKWLEKDLDLPNGIPSSDTFNRVLQLVQPKTLSNCLKEHGLSLFNCISTGLEDKLISFDGKKIRGASPKSRGNKGLYI